VLKVGRGAAAPPFIVMDVIAAANARQASLPPGAQRVIRMEVGQPGTGAPAGAAAAATAALQSGDSLGYTEAFGRRSLRERIGAHYHDWYGLHVPVERVAVTVGASGAFPLAFLAAFDRGDRIALSSPFYPPYVNILTALGMQPLILEAGPETRYQPSVAMLQRLDPPPDGLIVASPCNPAGTMLHQTSWHDNSAANKNNPDPGNWVGGGERTVDEMSIAHIDFIYLTDEDYEAARKTQRTTTDQQQ